MAPRGTVLVVECLGLGSWLYAAAVRWRFERAHYASEGWLIRRLGLAPVMARLAGLTPMRFEDFPGSYFDVQRETVGHANDAFHDAHGRGHPLLDVLLACKGDGLLDVALRKAVLLYYTLPRVKAWVFLEEMVRRHGHVVFVPRDNLPFARYIASPWGPTVERCRVPTAARVLNALREALARLLVAPAVLIMLGELVWRRGLRRATKTPRTWPVAFDMFSSGIAWDRPRSDEILYDGKEFTPQRVLHVVRDRLVDEATRRHFEANGYPYVEFGRVPLPAGRSLVTAGRAIGHTLRVLHRILAGSHASLDYLVPFLAVLRAVLEHEAFFAHHRVGVFVARDEYSIESVVRTALIHEHGGKTVGFTRGDDAYTSRSNQNIAMDVLCYPSAYQRDLLHPGNAGCGATAIIGVGVYGLDDTFRAIQAGRIPPKYADIAGTYRVVGAFPTSFATDFCITREHLLSFYRAVLALEDMYDDVYVIVCPKNPETGSRNPDVQDLLSHSRGRVVIEETISTYEIIPLCDLMICMACTSVGLEGLTAGKRVLYLEETGFRDHPYRRYDDRLVAWTVDELTRSVKWVLDDGGYVAPSTLERIREYHGLCFDGQVTERLRDVARRALHETPLAAAWEGRP